MYKFKLSGEDSLFNAGTAPVVGNGCGVNGGNLIGCLCPEDGSNYCYGDDDRDNGACCAKVSFDSVIRPQWTKIKWID